MQRVAIARAMLNNPKIIIADEPTGNLDSRNAHAILDIFRELHRGGQTVVMVTHNQQLASEAGRIVTMLDGHVVSVRSPLLPPAENGTGLPVLDGYQSFRQDERQERGDAK